MPPGFLTRPVKLSYLVISLASFKAGKYEIQKRSTCRATLFRCKFFVDVSRFSPCVINLSRNICCGLKKVVAKSRAQVYFEQQILALLLVFHQTHNLSRNKFARALANQPISALHFFKPQQMFLLRVKLITQGEKRETSTNTCNETMLRDKLRVFVSRISPPLVVLFLFLADQIFTDPTYTSSIFFLFLLFFWRGGGGEGDGA